MFMVVQTPAQGQNQHINKSCYMKIRLLNAGRAIAEDPLGDIPV